ncbi:acyl-CoA thioesterase [Pseudoalteromonas denitrificans]|uniref:Acyl-CoA thioester hydrolase n=1 Tax=Pseudoalteromonas denitrificans DSM 6059 TaxID=1123010 RepID=A0A1I1I826_9GAMM|nr:thioesterase family protein [Pseudoalteromonas denitrificans]SFC30398.1 acyl-CoA thioester hydrolase [Pseudoalteromonas denitrificans DSM 6059]
MTKNAILSASVDIEIPFHDCDPMQVVWHGNYARYFEVARCALLRKIDFDYLDMQDSGYVWPIVDMRTKFVGSALFAQMITVDAHLVEYESRLKIAYLISCKLTGKKLTKAHTVQVAVDLQTKEMQFVSPDILTIKLRAKNYVA